MLLACCSQYLSADASRVFASMSAHVVPPDLLAYNLMLTSLSFRGQLPEARALLGRMEEAGVRPNAYTLRLFLQVGEGGG